MTEPATTIVPHTTALTTYLVSAFDFFNGRLWGGKLPPAVLGLHRNPKAFGYYHGNIYARIENGKMTGKADELMLNPQYVATRVPREVHATLVHEMCHHWQQHFDKNPSRSYHNKPWGTEMKRIGLYPSSTGRPGGKETGQYVSHYIIEGGPFALACEEFLAKVAPIFFQDRAALARSGVTLGSLLGLEEGEDDEEGGEEPPKKRSKGRAKFTCPQCGLNATAKPSAMLICGECNTAMETPDGD